MTAEASCHTGRVGSLPEQGLNSLWARPGHRGSPSPGPAPLLVGHTGELEHEAFVTE